jgi:hypothetical protein
MSSQDFRLGGRPLPLFKSAFGAAVALGALGLSPGSAQAACDLASPANACRVTVGGLQYDVTTFTGSYNNNMSKFAPPPAPGVMPWWGSEALANEFATQVGSGLGQPNNDGGIPFGPVFAYVPFAGKLIIYYYDSRYPSPSILRYDALSQADSFTWAQVNVSAVPAPAPLFGAAAAFGFSRRLRKRIQGSRLPIGSSQPRA